MAVFKCKMCGGQLEVQENQTVIECEYCETKQTVSKTNDGVIANLFNRANNLRIKGEFDKAMSIYEKIVEQDDSDSEAHWGIVLCKYGIEYVEDPVTFKRVPTCHRTLFESILKDVDYEAAIDYADAVQQQIYEKEARMIDKIQKDILTIVNNEKPFDVFICYKETDENGKRTVDSTIANDIYYQLTQEGFKVFYAAITLEDKLGQEYEPYIFAALNSAKVMLVLGTKPEYFNAVWVKNEWSRYMKLIKTDRSKLLIPCYRDMDAYDLPEEFAHLQSQDMSKIGFINDVVRGIKKVVQIEQPKTENIKSNHNSNPTVDSLLKRAFMFIEERKWDSAIEYCEKVLDIDPENARAYLGKLMIELKKGTIKQLCAGRKPFNDNRNYKMAVRYADDKFRNELIGYNNSVRNNMYVAIYDEAVNVMNKAKNEDDYLVAAGTFGRIKEYKDSEKWHDVCLEKAKSIKNTRENKKENIRRLVDEYKSLYVENKQNTRLKAIEEELSQYENGSMVCRALQYISAKVGDVVKFGKYKQFGSDKEAIEWIVLDKRDHQVLLTSKYILDCQVFDDKYYASEFRSMCGTPIDNWLFNEFKKDAFDAYECELICINNIKFKHGTEFSRNDFSKRHVFLLSMDELNKYFVSNEDRKCSPTKYASSKGARPGLINKNTTWWLRDTKAGEWQYAASVMPNGSLANYQLNVANGVRPCVWVGFDIDSMK